MTTIQELTKKYYAQIAPLDLELLFSFVLKKSREFILAHPEHGIAKNQESRIKNQVKRRMAGKPIAYIIGKKEFYGSDFKVNENTLIPRPETELLVELALKKISTIKQHNDLTMIDIGTGSGNIIIALAKQMASDIPNGHLMSFFGIDISKKALATAKQNAKQHKVDKKIKFLQGNLIDPIIGKLDPPIGGGNSRTVVLANLPYLDSGWKNLLKSAATRGLKYEPNIALYAGKDGLDAYRKLATQIKTLSRKTRRQITLFLRNWTRSKTRNAKNIFVCQKGKFSQRSVRKLASL